MEANKEATSSSSLATHLFGSKDSLSSSSSNVFDSIFPPPSKGIGGYNAFSSSVYVNSLQAHRKDYINSQESKNYDSTTKGDCLDNEAKSQNPKTDTSLFYQQEASQPCHLSSSIYYGGQDIYINPRITKNTPGYSKQYDKDGEDDGLASRGNWWKGSLYY